MALAEQLINCEIVRIFRVREGYGGAKGEETDILRDVPAIRQAQTEVVKPEAGQKEESVDASFWFALPATLDTIRVGDRMEWRRKKPNGEFSATILLGAEIRRVRVQDAFEGSERSHIKLLTRGGDGTGA